MKSVFYLAHEWYDGEYDYITDIAVYSTLEKAEKALKRLKRHKKFKDHPEGFGIDEYEIDKDHWTEGFFIASEMRDDEFLEYDSSEEDFCPEV